MVRKIGNNDTFFPCWMLLLPLLFVEMVLNILNIMTHKVSIFFVVQNALYLSV